MSMSSVDQDYALGSNGCLVSFSSCSHEEVASIRNIIDGSRSTFWATTGLYPHTFIVTFQKPIKLTGITIRSYCVKSLLIERCAENSMSAFHDVKSLELQLTDLHHQVSRMDLDSVIAKHLRFTVKEGYQEFCAVYKTRWPV